MMAEWIDRTEAMARLGVKAQTLYAYVSRGRIEMRPHPHAARASQYRAADVDALADRKSLGRRPQAIASASLSWGEPSIPTSLSTIIRGRLIYRGRDAVSLSSTASLEEIAALLWDSHGSFASDESVHPASGPFQALVAQIDTAPPVFGRSRQRLASDAGRAVAALALAVGARHGSSPLHARLAARWGLNQAGADIVRQALVLMADHDLNASTFACRVAASTGASMPACLLAGLSALSGPVHGGASDALAALLRDCASHGFHQTVRQWIDRHGQLPGFGHPLYPEGDARAAALLERISPDADLQQLADAVEAQAGHRPNIDFALTALARSMPLPPDAPFTLFLLGRSVGWAAHVIEQAEAGRLIRPRGLYQGEIPNLAQ